LFKFTKIDTLSRECCHTAIVGQMSAAKRQIFKEGLLFNWKGRLTSLMVVTSAAKTQEVLLC